MRSGKTASIIERGAAEGGSACAAAIRTTGSGSAIAALRAGSEAADAYLARRGKALARAIAGWFLSRIN